MNYLSKKERENVPTNIMHKNYKDIFMGVSNQREVVKSIYNIHKFNGGILNYLYFKGIVPHLMYKWVSDFDVNHYQYNADIIEYMNKEFIKQNPSLYELKIKDDSLELRNAPYVQTDKKIKLDANVYRNTASLGFVDDCGNVQIAEKRFNNLLACDYNLIDVWAPQTTEYTNANMRLGNKIPIWQKSMNIRHYERDANGFRASRNDSSLGVPIRGYGGDFNDMIDQKIKLTNEQNTRSRF
jgi:hypothetical protein